MLPEPLRDPCSYYDQWLKEIETELLKFDSTDYHLKTLANLVANLTTCLRTHEKERVKRIIEQI